MARLREISFAQQALQNLFGLRRDMRFNANVYKSSLLNNRSRQDVLRVMLQDVAAYAARIKMMTDITSDTGRRAALKRGIEALGVTSADEVVTEYQELNAASINLAKVTIDTIEVRADQLLNDLVEYDSVWK